MKLTEKEAIQKLYLECWTPEMSEILDKLQEKAEKLENKFQLLLKYTGRDVVSCIEYIKLLEEENKQLKELLGENKKFIKTGTMIYEDESRRPKERTNNES